MIRLHTAGTPNGRKVSIALEELGLEYEVHAVKLGENEQRSREFLALNPNNKIPVLEDDDLVVWESGAILLHLAETYGQGVLLSTDPARRTQGIQYAFFQTGGVGPNLGRLASALRKQGEKSQEMIEIFSEEMKRLYGVLDRILSDGREYLAVEYSIGDIMHSPWLVLPLDMRAPDLVAFPRVVEWLERIGKRPAVERGMSIP